MKKIIAKALALMFVLLLAVCMLCSCTDKILNIIPNGALRSTMMLNLANKNIEDLDSYSVKAKMDIYVDGASLKSISTSMYSEIGDDDYSVYSKTESVSSTLSSDTTQKIVCESGYYGGEMFKTTTKDGRLVQKLCAEISVDDYVDYEENVLSASEVQQFEFKSSDIGSSSCEEQEDGSWIATFADFSDEAVEQFRLFFNNEGSINIDFENITLEVIANEDLILTNMNIDFVFEEKSTNKTSIEISYYDFDNVAYEPVDTKDFKKVDDLTILDEIANELEKTQSQDSGSFHLTQSETASYAGNKQSASETYYVTYNTDDGFAYEIEASASEQLIAYENGEVKTYENGKLKKTEKSNDFDEKASITMLMDYTSYSPNMISDISVLSSNDEEIVYTLSVDWAYGYYYETYLSIIKGYNGKINSASTVFEIKLKDGELVYINTVIKINATVRGSSGFFTFKSNCYYD